LGITCYYISDTWQLKQSLLGFELIVGSHTGWNLTQIVEKDISKYSLGRRLLAVAADNASNNTTLWRTLEASLHAQNISWDSESMAINCLTHILNLSAKKLLQGLYIGYSSSDDDDDGVYESEVTVVTAAGQDDDSATSPIEELLIGDTVLKVRPADIS
jgi:hypothetical protein